MRSKMASKGFTLIELMIAVTIIGIITAALMLAQRDTGYRRRDAKRFADAKQIQDALALHITKMQSYPVYDGCLTGTDAVNAALKASGAITDGATFVDPLDVTDATKCYYYSGTTTDYIFRYTIERDSPAGKAGVYTIVP
jgi:prepilin-type N-terminal cleavage/methylation domain-containing protein